VANWATTARLLVLGRVVILRAWTLALPSGAGRNDPKVFRPTASLSKGRAMGPEATWDGLAKGHPVVSAVQCADLYFRKVQGNVLFGFSLSERVRIT
jgi:hypothetical protein